ncbi:LacI family DNA-binding transcriptional regulator [Actinoplanes sp. NPDC026670]|uniref:LacI family DNA-binding transcriptional regulator n=1 Tax=Actinoplanes sp. NPDC026670 TaxID=3154700 RepID=UPI0033FD4C48
MFPDKPSANEPKGKSRVTIYDVAHAAGLSHATVSRHLNGGKDVSPAARTAIERAITETGFVPNHHARRLAGGRSKVVALFHCVDNSKFFTDPNINHLMLDCNRVFSDHGIMTVIPVTSNGPARAATRHLASRIVDPAVLFCAPSDSQAVADLIKRRLPLVACGTPIGHEHDVSYVTTDDRLGAREMVAYLRRRRRRIAMIAGPADLPGGIQRLAGYQDVIGVQDPALVVHGDFSYDGGLLATAELLRRAPDLDAIFVASDLMARGALAALQQAGRRVPDDVAVAGFDDSPAATHTHPRLTTVRIPWRRYPYELVQQLLRRMYGDGPSSVTMPVELVIRESA